MRLPQLVAALELVDGREPGTLYPFARACRDSGVIPRSPVGYNALSVTFADAANLLIATALPVPVKLVPPAVATFRALPRRGDPRAFRIGRSQRYLGRADYAGDFLDLLIEYAPQLPDDIRVEFRFNTLGLGLIAGIDRTVAVEYWNTVKIGIVPAGGDRIIERSALFGIQTLRLVHGAVAQEVPPHFRRAAGARAAKPFSESRGARGIDEQERQPATFNQGL